MIIRKYAPADSARLFCMLREEGSEWECYYGDRTIEKYKLALETSLTYVAFEEQSLCGYARCREDGGFGVYVCDLLVAKPFRKRGIGRKLMEQACIDHPGETVYVMSDVDGYYTKIGYTREGSIFKVTPPSPLE
jgi:GNAT superfamily N-acetyltransferase